MNIHPHILTTIGQTPLVRLNRVTENIKATVAVKLEFFNPSGSLKDRAVFSMVERAEQEGKLKPGGTLIESTSGNTGYATAMVAAAKGYKCIIFCSESVAREKTDTLQAYGAEIRRYPPGLDKDDPAHYFNQGTRLAEELDNAVYIAQSYNQGNPGGHYLTTGPEIWEQTGGKITSFVTSAGTGGTITGTGRFLKEQNPEIEIVLADPVGSVYAGFLETGEVGDSSPYLTEAAGQDELYIPPAFDTGLVDRCLRVSDAEGFAMARRLAREEGIFCGMSSGLIVHAALQLAREKPASDLIVAIVCDAGDRYLTRLYSEEWLREKGL